MKIGADNTDLIPLSAHLLPRLACALNMRLFVHFVQTVQALPDLALSGKNDVSKIVQFWASLGKLKLLLTLNKTNKT
ncbi:TPA: hypothetical protein ACWZU0_000870 [Klebsiella oxytoca]